MAGVIRRGRTLACLTAAAIGLAGCASAPVPLIAEFEPAEKLAGVAVFRLKADEAMAGACARPPCSVNVVDVEDLAQALVDLDAFEAVEVGGTEQDFGIAVGTSAATRNARSIAVQSLLLWRGRQLAELNYDLPYTDAMARRDGGASAIAKSIVSHIVRDASWRRTFSAEQVHSILQASDYTTMEAPTEAGAFARYDIHRFVDPLLGVALRYRHGEPDGGHIDVFVYPIRASLWPDARAVLREESASVRRDLARLEEQGVHKLVRLREDELLHWSGAAGTVDLLRFAGELANADYQPYDTSTYVYLAEDKLVKVRATRPRNAPGDFDTDGFVRALMTSLRVPPESNYMREMRQYWAQDRDQ